MNVIDTIIEKKMWKWLTNAFVRLMTAAEGKNASNNQKNKSTCAAPGSSLPGNKRSAVTRPEKKDKKTAEKDNLPAHSSTDCVDDSSVQQVIWFNYFCYHFMLLNWSIDSIKWNCLIKSIKLVLKSIKIMKLFDELMKLCKWIDEIIKKKV